MPATRTITAHLDDKGDIEVLVLDDADAPCPSCSTPSDAKGWNFLTRTQGVEVFRCPTCSTAIGITEGQL